MRDVSPELPFWKMETEPGDLMMKMSDPKTERLAS